MSWKSIQSEQFDMALYSSEMNYNPFELDPFFNSIKIPQISFDDTVELEKFPNLEEINIALSNVQS